MKPLADQSSTKTTASQGLRLIGSTGSIFPPRDVRQRVNEPPDFSVAAADWPTLVEKFGSTSQLEDKAGRHEM
ncbi:hypothetical protein [Nocardia sp. alder85J]|uniref:hypothetical protein n=1 Tax=Nocardia sp. alder85J TaxID=2862949 RepID=UPI001CD785D7|nr:hypothetical protein [Nocardia sp. alder85J]MCX4095532.1 hypothetical protein [Nocardia sp. alder85J]